MTFEAPNQVLGMFQAAADLSAKKWYIVQLNSSGKIAAMTATTDVPFGILRNDPVTDEACSISPIGSGGISRIYLGATLAKAALVASDATGKAMATAATHYTVGQLVVGGDDTEIGSVLLNNLIVKA